MYMYVCIIIIDWFSYEDSHMKKKLKTKIEKKNLYTKVIHQFLLREKKRKRIQ